MTFIKPDLSVNPTPYPLPSAEPGGVTPSFVVKDGKKYKVETSTIYHDTTWKIWRGTQALFLTIFSFGVGFALPAWRDAIKNKWHQAATGEETIFVYKRYPPDDASTTKASKIGTALHPKEEVLPAEIQNFIDRVNKENINTIPIGDLETGLDAALKIAIDIKSPENKTTLLVVAEKIAQSHLSLSSMDFNKAIAVRMKAAQAISPAPPLGDLQIQLQKEHPKLGLKLYSVDTSLFKNHTLAIQKRKYTDGKTRLHVDAKISHPAREQLESSLNQIASNSQALFNALPIGFCSKVTVTEGYNFYEGRVTANGKAWTGNFSSDIERNGFQGDQEAYDKGYENCKVINFEGVGKVTIGTADYYLCEYNRITIDLDPNVSEADAAAKLNIIFAALGLGAVSSSSREQDIERIKVMQLFRAYYPQQAYTFERDQKTFEEPVESLKKRIEAKVPKMKDKFKHFLVDHPEDMYQQEVYPGQSIWAIKGLTKEVKNAGGIGLMAGIYGNTFDDAGKRLASMLKSGSLSTQDRFQVGIIAGGNSSDLDLEGGGGDYVFTRLLTDNMSKKISDYPLPGEMQVLYDLDLVERVGYGYSEDKYGNKHPDSYEARSNIIELTKEIKTSPNDHKDNEICIRNRIPPEYIKGVRVDNTSEKNQLINILKTEGLVKKNSFNQDCINDIPVDIFIRVGHFRVEYWA